MGGIITYYQITAGRQAKPGPKTSLPKKLPQYTFAEVYRLSQAMAAGDYAPVKGAFAFSHTIKDAVLQVKVAAGQMPQWWDGTIYRSKKR
jgi:hypothetical protein